MIQKLLGVRDFLADERTLKAVKHSVMIALLAGLAFDLIAPETFHKLKDALVGLAF